jgi:outer membrane protein TolC
MRTHATTARRAGAAALVAAALAGCASFSPDGGFGPVAGAVREHTGREAAWARTETEREALEARASALLAKGPLSADDAVQVALFNNRGLQAQLAELGLAEADLVQAARLPNPRFTIHRVSDDHHYALERSISFNILSLVTLPLATEVEKRRFEGARQRAAMDVLRLASDTRKAWIDAVAAEEAVRYLRRVRLAADAGAELAARMAKAGNWSALQRAREQGFYADAALAVARAEQKASSARERLTRHLGLWGPQASSLSLPERLPDLPGAARDRPDIEREAIATRLDVRAAMHDAEATARNLGLTKVTRLVNVLEFGASRENEGRDEPYVRGYEISLEVPLFDWGTARTAKAETLYRQAVDRAAETAINARSEVREAYRHYRLAHDIARHYRDEIVPLRKRIAEENLLRYNGMLIGVFDLLADARAQIASVTGYVEALREFWIAEAGLGMAMIGRTAPPAVARAAMPQAESGGGH